MSSRLLLPFGLMSTHSIKILKSLKLLVLKSSGWKNHEKSLEIRLECPAGCEGAASSGPGKQRAEL